MKNLILILLISFCCLRSTNGQQKSTIINLKYIKKPKDIYTKFQRYQKFALEDYTIVDAPEHTVKENISSTTYTFQINEPSLLNLGFHIFYIEPTDSVSINYHLNSIDENQTPDETINMLTKKGLLLSKNGETVYDKSNLYADIKDLNNKNDFLNLLSENYIEEFKSSSLKDIYRNNKNFVPTSLSNQNLENIVFQNFLITCIKGYERQIGFFSVGDQKEIKNRFIELIYKADEIKNKSSQFYLSLQGVFEIYYRDKWKNANFNYSLIKDDLKDFSPITAEYLLLMILKKDLIFVKNNTANLNLIKANIKQPTLAKYASIYTNQKNIGRIANGYISNNLRNTKIFDTNYKELLFGDLFTETTQPYLYLDFCGFWCKPCLEEIDEYTKTIRKYDNSEKLKPIWLFFENNNQAWLKTIEMYKLPKDNCFMVIEKDIQNYFSQEFEWQGEFLHHFVFRKNELIIEKKAASLVNFKTDDILDSNIAIPPPPMLDKKN